MIKKNIFTKKCAAGQILSMKQNEPQARRIKQIELQARFFD